MYATSRGPSTTLYGARTPLSSYSPTISVNESRATSQESDRFSYSSSVNGFKGRSTASPFRRGGRSSSAMPLSNVKYPLTLYRKSKTFKKLSSENLANDSRNSSTQLSIKVAEFLKRTDHVASEWFKIGKQEKRRRVVNGLDKKIDEYFGSVKGGMSKQLKQNGSCDGTKKWIPDEVLGKQGCQLMMENY